MRSARIGFTLAEVLLSITIGGVVIVVISSTGVRQMQFGSGIGDVIATATTVQDAVTILSLDLRGADPLQGDLPSGEARDTSIQFRSTIATSIVCDTVGSALVLSPSTAGVPTYGSTLSAPAVHDSVWLLVADTSEHWEPHVITSVSTGGAGQCAVGGPVLSGAALNATRTSLRVNPAVAGSAIGMPIRITRPLRYSLYKSSDGLWYLGQRDWNASTQRLNSTQPIAGPLLPPGTRAGLAMAYADSSGAAIPSATANTRTIASVRITARAQTARAVKISGLATGANGVRVDSASALVTFRSK